MQNALINGFKLNADENIDLCLSEEISSMFTFIDLWTNKICRRVVYHLQEKTVDAKNDGVAKGRT